MPDCVQRVLQTWKPGCATGELATAEIVLVADLCEELRTGNAPGLTAAVRRWAAQHADAGALLGDLSRLRLSLGALGHLDEGTADALFNRLALLSMEQAVSVLQAEARTDSLTGVGNRRAFDDRVDAVLSFAGRHAHRVSICILDVDGLKARNDTQGHQAGDESLRALADALRRAVRTEDEIFRIGGDEFALVMPFCSDADAERILGRLRAGDAPSFSYGMASYPADGLTAATLVAVADLAMYRSRAVPRLPLRVDEFARLSQPRVTKVLLAAVAVVVALSGAAFARAMTNENSAGPVHQASAPDRSPFPVTAAGAGGGAVVAPAATLPSAAASAPNVHVVTASVTPARPAAGPPAPARPTAPVVPLPSPAPPPSTPSAGTTPASPTAVGAVVGVVGGAVSVVGNTLGGVLGSL